MHSHFLQFTYERVYEDNVDHYFVFSNLQGFYLWTTSDTAKLTASIVPLVQKLYWINEHEYVVPRGGDLDPASLLAKGVASEVFESTSYLKIPGMPIEGEWWQAPGGTEIFVPVEGENMCQKILDKIKADFTM